jgi:hypothetical protein
VCKPSGPVRAAYTPVSALVLTIDSMWSMATGILAMKPSGGDGLGEVSNGFAHFA